MIITGPWEVYTPENAPVDAKIEWLTDPLGQDWYVYRRDITAPHVFLIDQDGSPRAYHTDPSYLTPCGLRVAEIDQETIPEDFTFSKYRITLDGFVARELSEQEKIDQTKTKRTVLLNGITDTVSRLKMLESTDSLDEESQAELNKYITYIKALMGINLVDPVWPTL
jgi:hypothetical protein